MSEFRGTPGPWFVLENGHCVAGPATDLPAQHNTAGVAMCGMGRRSPEEREANARLIAAAPCLLAALIDAEQMLLVAMNNDLVFSLKTRAEIIAGHPGMAAIRAAIAKATGGTA